MLYDLYKEDIILLTVNNISTYYTRNLLLALISVRIRAPRFHDIMIHQKTQITSVFE